MRFLMSCWRNGYTLIIFLDAHTSSNRHIKWGGGGISILNTEELTKISTRRRMSWESKQIYKKNTKNKKRKRRSYSPFRVTLNDVYNFQVLKNITNSSGRGGGGSKGETHSTLMTEIVKKKSFNEFVERNFTTLKSFPHESWEDMSSYSSFY